MNNGAIGRGRARRVSEVVMEEDMMARRVRQALARIGNETADPARRGAPVGSGPAAIDVEAVRRRVAAASGARGGRGRDTGGSRPGNRVSLRGVVRAWAPRLPVVLAVLALIAVALSGGSDSGRESLEDDVDDREVPVTAGDGLPEDLAEEDGTEPGPGGGTAEVP